MKTKVVHCKKEPYDIYIGRPSKWGNPFSHKEGTAARFKASSRKEAIQKYVEWLSEQEHLLADLHELKGKVLGCWCAPLGGLTTDDPCICHGQVLLELANF